MADSPDVVNGKAMLRTSLLAGRSARSAADRAAAADALCAALLAQLVGVPVVAATVPLEDEPGAGRLPAALRPTVGRVLLPVVPETGRELLWAEDDGTLATGRFGLLEPTGPRQPPTTLADADVILVPALAVARDGTRLGRGGGYYDRALPHARPDAVLVALVYDDELIDVLPAGEHDRPVSAVVTPGGGWRDLRPPR
ncbi:5-formyltetrahydrofolate cyclo-ligase [Modestobacter sp. NPDC049651]|uniref:5-formyltetrahydrofolate cyclo-ligase n=1 Tax=unclassified Modestobacter TaxID=2643866 RepID=UPI0034049898